MRFPEVMTITEVAEYLRLPQSTLSQLAREGDIPGMKVGSDWRFHRDAVDQWLGVSPEDDIEQNQSWDMQAQFGSAESFDISEHAELVGKFDVRLNQLSSGKFHGKVDYVKTPGMMIYEEHWQRKVEVCGVTPEGYITLGTNVAWRRSEIEWCGTTVDHRRFACGKQGSDIDFIMPDQCHDAVLLVKPDILASALSQQAFDLLTGGRTIDFTAVAGQRLITAITGSVRKYAKSPKLLENSFLVRSLESEMIETLSSCIADSNQDDSIRPHLQHKAYVRNAIAQAECSDQPLTATELAMAVGVSQRTLNYAFQNVLDITPYSYLQMHRLNAAHREFAVADPKVSTVTSIALKWGFSHAGRFSILYRKLFDEMPSETLRRA